MLDFYLTALVDGPCSIPPDEWGDDQFGARGRIAVARGTMLAAIEAIVARFNAIGESLATAPGRCAPIFEKTEDGLAHSHPWCLGFLTAIQLRLDALRPALDADWAESAAVPTSTISFVPRTTRPRAPSRRSRHTGYRNGCSRRTVNAENRGALELVTFCHATAS